MTTAEVVEFNPEVDHEQLLLDGSAFQHIKALADAGAITPTSLNLSDPELPFDTWEALGAYLGRMNRSCSWWIGDWLIFGEGAYGERYAQALAATGLAEQTLLNRIYVCRHVPASRRRASLPFSLHAEVAALPAREQTTWLKRAEKHGWTKAALRDAMKSSRRDEAPPLIPDPSEPDMDSLLEVGMAILRDAKESGDPAYFLIPREDMARLRAALGEEE